MSVLNVYLYIDIIYYITLIIYFIYLYTIPYTHLPTSLWLPYNLYCLNFYIKVISLLFCSTCSLNTNACVPTYIYFHIKQYICNIWKYIIAIYVRYCSSLIWTKFIKIYSFSTWILYFSFILFCLFGLNDERTMKFYVHKSTTRYTRACVCCIVLLCI